MPCAARMNTMRSPGFVTQTWVLTPSHLNYRAGKHSRSNTSFAYRVFIEIPRHNILRSPDPFRMGGPRHDGRRGPSLTTRIATRRFHQSTYRCSAGASAIPHISLHIAASSSGKGSKFRPDKSTYDYENDGATTLGLEKEGQSIFQKRRARPDSGQDAYFIAPVGGNTNETAFGICDGVGGWSDHGIDPADFSHGLCSYMAKSATNWSTASEGQKRLHPQHLLEMGYQQTVKDPDIKGGGSTACVGLIDGDGRMRIANLGDSGYVHLRLGKVQNYSSPQTHAFNTPYQLSLTPPEVVAQAMIFGGLPLNDLPERADTADHMLQHGDVIVLATDGLWDNLSSQDILTIVSNQMRQTEAWGRTAGKGYVIGEKLSTLVNKDTAMSEHNLKSSLQASIAASIVGEAKIASLDRKRDGPFAKAWQKQMPYDPFHGGKVDDIAVLVIIPVETDKKQGGGQLLKSKL